MNYATKIQFLQTLRDQLQEAMDAQDMCTRMYIRAVYRQATGLGSSAEVARFARLLEGAHENLNRTLQDVDARERNALVFCDEVTA